MNIGQVVGLLGMTLLIGGGCNLLTPVDDTNPGTKIDSVIAIPVTDFDYTGYDASGKEIVRGTLILHLRDSVTVEGTWEFEATGSTTDIGPQVGRGTLEGSAHGDTLFLNLNPGFADNNVILSGVLNGGDFSGTWSWIGIAGIIRGGTFHASAQLTGTWEWQKSAGGIWYHEVFPPPTYTIEFGADRSVLWSRNDTVLATTAYVIRHEQTFFSPLPLNVIHYDDSTRFMPQTYAISGDTLVLIDLCMDCFAHTYIRQK